MSSTPAPPEGDGRTRRDRSLPQLIGAAVANIAIERTELKRLGQAIVKAEMAGKLDKARMLRGLVQERKESIRLREVDLAELEARRDDQEARADAEEK